jgi:hypothetical protein
VWPFCAWFDKSRSRGAPLMLLKNLSGADFILMFTIGAVNAKSIPINIVDRLFFS